MHVFRSFTRLGSSNLNNTDKVDTFEVKLEDWLLEKLNECFVFARKLQHVPQTLQAHCKGNLRLSVPLVFCKPGQRVEKDYTEILCASQCLRLRSCFQDPRNDGTLSC